MENPTKKKGGQDHKALINICNSQPCDGQFGLFAKKCSRCAAQRHACVAVEPPMFPALNATVRARAKHAESLVHGDDETTESTKLDAEEAGKAMFRAGGAPAASNAETLQELQSLRRGVLGLVEVGKLGLRHLGVDTGSVDRILGVDAPASSEEEDENENEGKGTGEDEGEGEGEGMEEEEAAPRGQDAER
ncbi:hypothetical protein LTR85_000673 [Meristemomyces frigidus]|nr:hypothetical protein LTR85_000673 [Meristemomyces frigidus]